MVCGILALAGANSASNLYQLLNNSTGNSVNTGRRLRSSVTLPEVPVAPLAYEQSDVFFKYQPTPWSVQILPLGKVYDYEEYFSSQASANFSRDALMEMMQWIKSYSYIPAPDDEKITASYDRHMVLGLDFYLVDAWPLELQESMLGYQLDL